MCNPQRLSLENALFSLKLSAKAMMICILICTHLHSSSSNPMAGKRDLMNAKHCNYIQFHFSGQACMKYTEILCQAVRLTSLSNKRRPHMDSYVLYVGFLCPVPWKQPSLMIQLKLVVNIQVPASSSLQPAGALCFSRVLSLTAAPS